MLTSSIIEDNSSSVNLSISAPIKTLSLLIPTVLHMFSVAYLLSPVITFKFMPAFLSFNNTFLTSFLGGSKNPTKPINIISFSSLLEKMSLPGYSFFSASAITCIPSSSNSLAFLFTTSIILFVIFSSLFPIRALLQDFITSSKAPLVIILYPFAPLTTMLVFFLL